MIDAFDRTGPLMDASSYPAWAQQLIKDCSAAKARVVEHELYQQMRDAKLSPQIMRHYLIGGWPVVESCESSDQYRICWDVGSSMV